MPQNNTFPFTIKDYMEYCQIGMATWETLFYRGLMFHNALDGKTSFSQPEFNRMFMEKVQAGIEGSMAASMEWQKFWQKAFFSGNNVSNEALEKLGHSMFKAGMAPGFKTVQQNAKRLRNQKQ